MDIYLVFRSVANTYPKDIKCNELLFDSKGFNTLNNITGCLLYCNGEFLEILEGEVNTVNKLYDRIQQDNRHYNITLLLTAKCEQRQFRAWDMVFDQTNNRKIQDILIQRDVINSINKAQVTQENLAYQMFCAIGNIIINLNSPSSPLLEQEEKKSPLKIV